MIQKTRDRNPLFYEGFLAQINSGLDTAEEKSLHANFIQLICYMDSMLLLDKMMMGVEIERLSNVCAVDDLYMDSQCLAHLEILETQTGVYDGSLFSIVNRCNSPMGKRLLAKWLRRPSARVDVLNDRLQAIQQLHSVKSHRDSFGNVLKNLKDVQKLSTQLYKYSLANERKVILFEDATTKKLKELFDFFTQIEKLVESVEKLQSDSRLKKNSNLLAELLSVIDSNFVRTAISEIKSGIIINKQSIIPVAEFYPEFDACERNIHSVYQKAEVYAHEMRKRFNNTEICVVSSKFRFEIEIPEKIVKEKGVPPDFQFASKRQNYERFINSFLEQLIDEIEEQEEVRKEILIGFGCLIFRRFLEHKSLWESIFAVTAHLDVLSALSEFSFESNSVLCKPVLHAIGQQRPFLTANNIKHPVLAYLDNSFVGNDVSFSTVDPVLVLSGPNMGGKSTIMRTLALNIVLAQIGCFVFADHFELTLADKIFTRIGASDKLEEKKSTFFIEMEEMKNILQFATFNSFVVIDELGRGTSTFDGYSIACACLTHLASKLS